MTGDKITEADLAYLRNIDTRPGPNAGGAIDKRLPPYEAPTPASADVIEGMRAYKEQLITILLARIDVLDAALNAVPSGDMVQFALTQQRLHEAKYIIALLPKAALALPDSKPTGD